MKLILAAIVAILPLAAWGNEPEKPKRPSMEAAAIKARETPAEKTAAAVIAATDLVRNTGWLSDIANEAATTGRKKFPKLPDGVAVTVLRLPPAGNNPFGNTPGERPPGVGMRQVASEIADGKRGRIKAAMWIDERKIDYERIKGNPNE